MPKMSKEDMQRKQIADAVVTFQTAREQFEKLLPQYDQWMDEAAELGEDAYSDEIIAAKVEVMDTIRDFKFLESQIKQAAVSANAFASLKDLPQAIAACNNIANLMPNLKGLGKKMSGLKDSLAESRDALHQMRQQLSGAKSDSFSKLFGANASSLHPDMQKKIEEEKKARQARLAAKVAASGIAVEAPKAIANDAPKASAVTSAATDSIDDIIRAIEAEKKKK